MMVLEDDFPLPGAYSQVPCHQSSRVDLVLYDAQISLFQNKMNIRKSLKRIQMFHASSLADEVRCTIFSDILGGS